MQIVSSVSGVCTAESRKIPSEKGLPESASKSVFIGRECTNYSVNHEKLYTALREHVHAALVLRVQRALVAQTRLFQSFKEFAESHDSARRGGKHKIPEYNGANLPSNGENCTRLRRGPVQDLEEEIRRRVFCVPCREENARAVVDLENPKAGGSKTEVAESRKKYKSPPGSAAALKDEETKPSPILLQREKKMSFKRFIQGKSGTVGIAIVLRSFSAALHSHAPDETYVFLKGTGLLYVGDTSTGQYSARCHADTSNAGVLGVGSVYQVSSPCVVRIPGGMVHGMTALTERVVLGYSFDAEIDDVKYEFTGDVLRSEFGSSMRTAKTC